MTSGFLISQLAKEIHTIYAEAPRQAPRRIEALLKEHWGALPPEQARKAIGQLMARFPADSSPSVTDSASERQLLSKVFKMILGDDFSQEELNHGQMLERLSQSLNTVFDALNQLISSINSTLSGNPDGSEHTIRQFIGFHMEQQHHGRSLEAYLGQINDAFLTTQQAMKQAVQTKVDQILQAVDPQKIEAGQSGGLKIGPLRKAEAYELLKEKIQQIQRWFSSGHFMEDFLREFEKNCQAFSRK